MAMTPVQLERTVRRLDNDVQAIYELLSAIQGTQLRQGNRLDEIDVRLESLDTKLESLDTKLESLDARADSVDGKLDEVLRLLRPGSAD